jgi:hypothetical protein
MSNAERFGAFVFGSVLAAVGLLAMFTTKNEAGTAVAILLGAVLILVGLQGTQILKLGGKDVNAEWARREMLVKKVREVIEEEPSVAKAMIEGYQIADPNARQDPAVVEALNKISASVDYQRQLTQVLRSAAGPNAALSVEPSPGKPDFMILDRDATVLVEAIYAPDRALNAQHIDSVLGRLNRSNANGAVIVTNAKAIHPRAAAVTNAPDSLLVVAQFAGPEDTERVYEAVDTVRERISRSRRAQNGTGQHE